MKILSTKQRKDADQFTINNEPISSIKLMERASGKCADWIFERFGTHSNYHVVTGTGNNGGDGLAIARLLKQRKCIVKVSVLCVSEKGTPDFEMNLKQGIKSGLTVNKIGVDAQLDIQENEIIVDAIFGLGLSKPIAGTLCKRISEINKSISIVIAIDTPSGLFMDKLNLKKELSVQADFTLTFQSVPLSFLFVENDQFIGEWHILDIGLVKSYFNSLTAQYHFIEPNDISSIIQTRTIHQHKGHFGHGYILAGSTEKGGAAVLAAKAAMRSGLGWLTMGIPESLKFSLQTQLPEAMLKLLGEDVLQETGNLEGYSGIGIGPGIGMHKSTANSLKLLIQNTQVPIVFDADAINLLAENKTWLNFIPENCIFTPHVGEFKRLVLNSDDSEARLMAQIEFSKKFNCVMILKGAYTQVSLPDGRVFFNSSGNPGMATAGSGDVLTGLITGLLARGYHSMYAAILGVYLHGLAGDLAAVRYGQEAMKASDIIEYIPEAFKKFVK